MTGLDVGNRITVLPAVFSSSSSSAPTPPPPLLNSSPASSANSTSRFSLGRFDVGLVAIVVIVVVVVVVIVVDLTHNGTEGGDEAALAFVKTVLSVIASVVAGRTFEMVVARS